MAVSLEEVYDSSPREARPTPSRASSHAYHHWTQPSRYVLLLGDASSDPKGYNDSLLPGTVFRRDRVPCPREDVRPGLVPTCSRLRSTATTSPSRHRSPDRQLHRGAQSAVQKILDSRDRTYHPDGSAVLVADTPDPAAGDFEANVNEIATLFSARPVQKLFRRELGVDTKAAVIDAFDQGPPRLLRRARRCGERGSLPRSSRADRRPQPQPAARQPLVLTMTCLNGAFTHFLNNSSPRC
jgi:hypothetical protein